MEYERNRREQSVPRKRKKRRSGAARGIFSVLGTLVLVGIFTGVMLVWIFMHYVDTTIKPSVQVRAEDYTMALSSVIYYQDRDTQEWKEYQTIHGKENRIYVDIEDMPDMLWKAAVAIEDERFFQHHGVDWKRTAGAVLKFFGSSSSTYGGSTITQQMLKNMTDDNKGTVNRKVREIFRALEFEKNYEKMDILELYLNTIYLGKGCYGVQTAAEYYFGKDVSELNVAECACLIAITNNPSIYGPMSTVKMTNPETGVVKTARELNKQRQENILFKMYDPKTGLCYLGGVPGRLRPGPLFHRRLHLRRGAGGPGHRRGEGQRLVRGAGHLGCVQGPCRKAGHLRGGRPGEALQQRLPHLYHHGPQDPAHRRVRV